MRSPRGFRSGGGCWTGHPELGPKTRLHVAGRLGHGAEHRIRANGIGRGIVVVAHDAHRLGTGQLQATLRLPDRLFYFETNSPELPTGACPAMHFIIRPAIGLGTRCIGGGHLSSPCIKKYGNVLNGVTLSSFQTASHRGIIRNLYVIFDNLPKIQDICRDCAAGARPLPKPHSPLGVRCARRLARTKPEEIRHVRRSPRPARRP